MFDLQVPPSTAPAAAPPVVEIAAPTWDLTVGLINATVQVDQPNDDDTRRVGTAFLIDAPRADGTPRTVLVTAAHVLEGMPKPEARVGWRVNMPDGRWRYSPEPLTIRGETGTGVWTRHPDFDVAVMEISAPPAFARAAIPLAWLADDQVFDTWRIGPGDEFLTLGYPYGYSANTAGFAILKTGRIASWPLTPISRFPSFLLDYAVFPGDSGGPVFWTPTARKLPGTPEPDHPFIAGVLIQEMRVSGETIGIGVVAHAQYVREAIALMDSRRAEAATGPPAAVTTAP